LTDHIPNDPRDQPGLHHYLGAIFAGIGVLAAAVSPVIVFVQGGGLAFRVGLFLTIIGAALGLGVLGVQFRRSGKLQALLRRRGLIMAAIVSLASIAAGLFLAASQPPKPTTCRVPAQVSGADTSAASFTVSVNLRCPMPSADKLYLVVQLLNEGVKGTVKHSEYYLAWAIKNSVGLTSRHDNPAGCTTRRYYLISVTLDQLALLQQSPRTSSGSYYGEPIDTDIGQYISSNIQVNHTCNKQA